MEAPLLLFLLLLTFFARIQECYRCCLLLLGALPTHTSSRPDCCCLRCSRHHKSWHGMVLLPLRRQADRAAPPHTTPTPPRFIPSPFHSTSPLSGLLPPPFVLTLTSHTHTSSRHYTPQNSSTLTKPPHQKKTTSRWDFWKCAQLYLSICRS